MSLLSFPPLASCVPSNDHLRPQTSPLWPTCLWVMEFLTLKSLLKTFLSLDPVLTVEPFQDMALTLSKCPLCVLTFLQATVSQI